MTEKCKADNECPSQTACFNGECINPCVKIEPCGINADCKVLDTSPVRTMICECIPGYRGNAVVRCDKSNFLLYIKRLVAKNDRTIYKIVFK